MRGVFFSKRNFLFDLDGTLIDSLGVHERAYVEALRSRHPKLAESFDYAAYAGQPTRQVFAALGVEEPELGALTLWKQELYREALGRGEVAVFPGVREMLARLEEMGRGLFLVTGSNRISVERILDSTGMKKYFLGVTTAEDSPLGKPAPEPYLVTMRKHGLAVEDCLAVEDGDCGVRSAQAAGLEVALLHSELAIKGMVSARDCAEFLEWVGA